MHHRLKVFQLISVCQKYILVENEWVSPGVGINNMNLYLIFRYCFSNLPPTRLFEKACRERNAFRLLSFFLKIIALYIALFQLIHDYFCLILTSYLHVARVHHRKMIFAQSDTIRLSQTKYLKAVSFFFAANNLFFWNRTIEN